MQFFLLGGIQLHTFATYALPCQTPFCQTAPLLSSVAWQQDLMEYWREDSTSTAISPTSASDIVGQHNKIGGINFGVTLVVSNRLGEQIVSYVVLISKEMIKEVVLSMSEMKPGAELIINKLFCDACCVIGI